MKYESDPSKAKSEIKRKDEAGMRRITETERGRARENTDKAAVKDIADDIIVVALLLLWSLLADMEYVPNLCLFSVNAFGVSGLLGFTGRDLGFDLDIECPAVDNLDSLEESIQAFGVIERGLLQCCDLEEIVPLGRGDTSNSLLHDIPVVGPGSGVDEVDQGGAHARLVADRTDREEATVTRETLIVSLVLVILSGVESRIIVLIVVGVMFVGRSRGIGSDFDSVWDSRIVDLAGIVDARVALLRIGVDDSGSGQSGNQGALLVLRD